LQLSEEPKDISRLTALDNMSIFIVWIIWHNRYIDYWIYQNGLPKTSLWSWQHNVCWEGCLKYIKVSKTVHNTVFSANIHTTDIESIERDELAW